MLQKEAFYCTLYVYLIMSMHDIVELFRGRKILPKLALMYYMKISPDFIFANTVEVAAASSMQSLIHGEKYVG